MSRVSSNRLRVGLVGCGQRARDYYVPLLTTLADFEPVGCVGRSTARAAEVAHALGCPSYADVEALLSRAHPDLVVVCVPYHANGEVTLELVDGRVALLCETPLAHRLEVGDAIVERARSSGSIVAVAEQFPRFPRVELVRLAIESGMFGRILHTASDFGGHGYHGMALARTLLGLDRVPLQALGIQRSFDVAPHWSRIEGRSGRNRERWDFGAIEFADGSFASFVFTDHGYDSPLRWHRQVRFFGSGGMGVDDRLTVLDPDAREPHSLPIQWDTVELRGHHWVRGLAVVAPPWLGGQRVECRSPYPDVPLRDDQIAVASALAEVASAVRDGAPVRYDAAQGLLDQECTLAIERSHERGGEPCRFPLRRGQALSFAGA